MCSNNDLRFKSSPFYNVVERLSLTKICSVNEIVNLDFVLDSNQIGKLKSSSNYKINLFCCYAEQNLQKESSIEFPDSCKVRVNNKMLPYKKSKQSPRDITDLCKITSHVNQIQFRFITTSKVIEEIVDEIKNGKFIEKDAVLEKIKKQIQDPDVVATSSIISLKDPLGQCRISTPCSYFNEILAKTTKDQGTTIVIDSNGNWAESKKTCKLHEIDEPDDVTFNKHSRNKKRKNYFVIDSSDGEGEKNKSIFIDLTQNSDDEKEKEKTNVRNIQKSSC
ncbi:18111_t:CDS:2 [Entrophospora sp. SA101]|nr:18111_t:CDS:2 [Entrophospora sp. SA101]CAJ0825575.1 12434_t:CDS:2 [Entrophospora sp. SA101]CAJ0837320.1 5766_t:CDS:2 [Entrophospora sp. SA101]